MQLPKLPQLGIVSAYQKLDKRLSRWNLRLRAKLISGAQSFMRTMDSVLRGHNSQIKRISMKWRGGRETVIMTTGFDLSRFSQSTEDKTLIPDKSRSYREFFQLITPRAILVACFVSSALTIAFFVFQVLVSRATYDSYTLAFIPGNINNKSTLLYVDEADYSSIFGESKIIDGVDITTLINSPLTLTWKPGTFPFGKTLDLSFLLKDEGDWDFSVYCGNCDAKSRYDWLPLYHGQISGYRNVSNFGSVNVYAKNTSAQYLSGNSVFDWLSKNADLGSSVKIFDNSVPRSSFASTNIDFVAGKDMELNTTLRGPHSFYLYLKDSFNIEIKKQDLNWYTGADPVKLTLYDADNNTVYENTIEDDETLGLEPGTVIDANFSWNNLPYAGVYKLSLSGNTDWLIKYLKVNTNKLVFTGKSLILDSQTIYTKSYSNEQVDFYVWHSTALQTFAIKNLDNSSVQNVKVDAQQLSKHQKVVLNKGFYSVSLKGDQYFTAPVYSFSEDSYFDPFIYNIDIDEYTKPDIALSSTNVSRTNNWDNAQLSLPGGQFLKLNNLNQIQFELRNTKLQQQYETNKTILDLGYHKIGQFDHYILWSHLDSYVGLPNSSQDDLSQFVLDSTAGNKNIFVGNNVPLNQSDFISNNEPNGLKSSESEYTTNLQPYLVGNHSLYVYLKSSLKLQVTVQDLNKKAGAENVNVQLLDLNGNILCNKLLPDDGDTSSSNVIREVTVDMRCAVPVDGVYVVNFSEEPIDNKLSSDFIIKVLKLNTNKITVKDRYQSSQPAVIYTNNPNSLTVNMQYSVTGKDQDIAINGQTNDVVQLNEGDRNQPKSYDLNSGANAITIPKGYVQLRGSSFALNPDGWFDIYGLQIVSSNLSADYYVSYQAYSSDSIIKTLTLNLR